MFGKKKKTEEEMSEAELKRSELIRRRCLGVVIVLDILILIYLVAQMVMAFTN